MDYNVRDIVINAQQGDDRAIAELYEKHYSKGINLANTYLHNRSDAEDIYQDAFIKAMQHLDQFDTSKDFGPWINTIIIRLSLNFLEKKHPDSFEDLSIEGMEFVDTIETNLVDAMPEESFNKKEMTRVLDEIMQELPEAQRQAMVLYYYKQMSIAEIAKTQNVPENSVKSRLSYGRKKVAEGVEKYQKKTGTKLLVMIPVLLTVYFRSGIVANAQTIVDVADAVDTGLDIADAAMDVAEMSDKAETAGTAAKTAGKILTKHLAKKTVFRASTAVIATGTLGGAAYVYETQINVETTDEAQFEWRNSEIVAYIGDEVDIVIPEKATSVGEKAFLGNNNIHSVDFSQSKVKNISRMAFKDCSMLLDVSLPETLETIGYEAFSNCSLISEISVPKNVRIIDGEAFSGCSSLSKLIINATSISKCDSGVFRGCALSDVTLSEDMAYIPENLFNKAEFMPETTVEIPKNVVSIGDRAFYSEGTKSPTYIKFLGNKITDIGYMSFYKCEVKDLELPDSLESIGFEAFGACENISKLTIPTNVHKIDNSAFADCVGLYDVTINATAINHCEGGIFNNCSLTNVTLSDDMTYIPENLFNNANFVGDVTIEIPANVVSIRDRAFYSDYGKSPVKFTFKGNKLDEIGYMSFYKCEMEELTLPKGIEKIGFNAFGGCSRLREIVIEASDIKFESAVFSGCDNINFKVHPATSVEQYLINEGFENKVTHIK